MECNLLFVPPCFDSVDYDIEDFHCVIFHRGLIHTAFVSETMMWIHSAMEIGVVIATDSCANKDQLLAKDVTLDILRDDPVLHQIYKEGTSWIILVPKECWDFFETYMLFYIIDNACGSMDEKLELVFNLFKLSLYPPFGSPFKEKGNATT